MNATSLYVSTCRLVLQANPEDPGCWADLYRLIPYLRQSLSCTVCGNLLIEPYTPTETNCQHHVCRSCKGGKKKLKPSCSWCKNYEKYVENVQLRILLQCYKKLCEYIINSSIYRLMCKTTATGDTNITNMTDLIQEGAGFKDEFKSNSGLSKSAYSILPCIYASASTQTITQAININNDPEIGMDEDVSVAKSNLSNGSSIYSVTYAGSGNKMVIKRKAMLNKGEMENCENLRLIKGSNFKRPIHRRGAFRGRGRGLKEEEKTNRTGVSNCTVSSNNLNNKRMNVKKKKLGCRCGNATASPGKLTCCGQRCPCYVDSKACLDCKCRGCRNPHTKEGQKVIRDPLDSANSKLQPPPQLKTEEGIPSRRAIANLGYGSQPAFSTDTVKFTPEMTVKSEIIPTEQGVKEITINVDYISNIEVSTVKEIAVRVEFKGEVLGQSLPVPVNQSSARIKLSAVLNDVSTSAEFMDELLSNPILFTVMDCTGHSTTSVSGLQVPVGEQKRKNSLSPATETPFCRALGYCNLDLGDFVTGQEEIKTILLVEPDTRESPFEVRTWLKLPRLSVYAVADPPLVPEQSSKFSNTIGITIESIYNVPEYVANGTNFEAHLPLPSVGDRANKIRFPNGVTIFKDNFPYKKKWLSLCHSENAGLRSHYRISQTYGDVFSCLPRNVEVAKEIDSSRRVVRWNTWKNCLMTKNDSNYFYNKLLKYGVWPIEIFYPGKSKDYLSKDRSARGDKKPKRAHSSSSSRADHFIAFLNLSPLLHPGVRKARVAAQLFTYSQEDILSKFGMDFLSDFGLFSQSQQSLLGSKRKTSSVKSRSSVKDTEENIDPFGTAVFDESDNPTFIIVEAEVLKSLVPHRSPESFEIDLKQILCLKEKLKPKTTTFGLMKENFSRIILNLMTILNEEHKNYSVKFPKETNNDCAISLDFEKYLYTQENFCRIKASLERTIIELIREKYGEANEEKIPEIYVYLVEEMYKVTNACLIAPKDVSNRGLYSDNLQLFAEEAFEDGDYKLAKGYILEKLSRNTSNSDYWLDYAVFCIKLRKFEEAVEAVKEALGLEFYHQTGLLMYALLMAKFLNPPLAESAAEILLTKYPNFVEGWVALSLIYSTFNNSIGAQVALQEAKKLVSENSTREKSDELSETEQDKFTIKVHVCQNKGAKYGVGSFLNASNAAEPLAWTTRFAAPTNFFIKTTVLLQKLGFYEYAALSLAEDLLSTPKQEKFPPQYVYYLSVNHYLQGRYEEAIPLLRSTVKEYGKDCFVWSLLGHCYYKLENHAEAIACYEFVKDAYNRPDDIHMIYSRLGYYYNQLNRCNCAKPLLLNACKYSPTPRTWKGVGLACLSLEEVENAEFAFTEANYLDNTDPDTWAYLALTNALLKRLDLFRQCYLEAKKRNLKNADLVNKIKISLALHGLEDKEF